MNVWNVALFGHREFRAHGMVEKGLFMILQKLLYEKEYVEIYIGRNGEFDIFAASIVKKAQNTFGRERIGMTLVLPYSEKNIEYYEQYYDSVIIPACVGQTHPKGAITKRNKWMVEESDLVICYVEREQGGAYIALKYAQKLEKEIINLATCENEAHSNP